MYNVYAIDRDGHEHGEVDCATLAEALEVLHDLVMDYILDSEPDNPFFVGYGVTFNDAGVTDLTRMLKSASAAG